MVVANVNKIQEKYTKQYSIGATYKLEPDLEGINTAYLNIITSAINNLTYLNIEDEYI